MDDLALGINQRRASNLEVSRRIWRLYEITGGKTFRVKDIRLRDIGYRPNQKSQVYGFCKRLAVRYPDLIAEDDSKIDLSYKWLGIPPQVGSVEISPSVDDKFRIMRAEIDALTSFATSLGNRVQELEAWENSCLENAATQVASTLAGLSPPQQEYVLRLAADLAKGKKSDK